MRFKTILFIALLFSCQALAQLDTYGGDSTHSCSGGATGRFYRETISGRDWLCDPAGHVFFSIGIYNMMPENASDYRGVNPYTVVAAKYAASSTDATHPTTSGTLNWCAQMLRRMRAWGFNTVDAYGYAYMYPYTVTGYAPSGWPTSDHTIPNPLPYMRLYKGSYESLYNNGSYASRPTKDLMWGVLRPSPYPNYPYQISDYYDPAYQAWVEGKLKATLAVDLHKAYQVGVISDDQDYLGWAGAGVDFDTSPVNKANPHGGWAILVSAPVQTCNGATGNVPSKQAYTDTTNYSKIALASRLTAQYGTIAALNTAWGSSYTTFGSTGTATTESLGTGDGGTVTFAKTLGSTTASRFSIQVLVAGVPVGGDNGNTSTLTGPGISSGTITYATGAISVTLSSAPTTGAAVTVTYVACGFRCGTGLLDEGGQGAWVPVCKSTSRAQQLTGSATIIADLDAFLLQFAQNYFAINRAAILTADPSALYWGVTNLGSWKAPPRKEVLQGANSYVDVVRASFYSDLADSTDRISFYAQYAPTPSLAVGFYSTSAAGYFAADPRGSGSGCGVGEVADQAARAARYSSVMTYITSTVLYSRLRFVGLAFWELFDNRVECSNFGLMTKRDNPYDGVSAVVASGTDAWGFPTGGEASNFGDEITGIAAANLLWRPPVTGTKILGLRLKGGRIK